MKRSYQSALFNQNGRRKYICGSELPRFLAAARSFGPECETFCLLLALTGCRISEGLGLTPGRLDPETGRVVFRTLKRRGLIFRAVPIPDDLMVALRELSTGKAKDAPIWGWHRATAWRKVKAVMAASGIVGPQAMPKGLRHGLGVASAEANVPMPTAQKWLGHASLETTAIYMEAVGREERGFANRLWRHWQLAAD